MDDQGLSGASGVPAEEWRPIPGFLPRYRISSLGRLVNTETGRELGGELDRDGYRRVNLSDGTASRKRRIHRLVCEAFHGPCPSGHECGHLNGTKLDNSATNLAWVTRRENMQHNNLHGVSGRGGPKGERHPDAKLTAEDVIQMRFRARGGESCRALGRAFGVGHAQANAIIRGAAWKGVPMPSELAMENDNGE